MAREPTNRIGTTTRSRSLTMSSGFGDASDMSPLQQRLLNTYMNALAEQEEKEEQQEEQQAAAQATRGRSDEPSLDDMRASQPEIDASRARSDLYAKKMSEVGYSPFTLLPCTTRKFLIHVSRVACAAAAQGMEDARRELP